MRTLTLPLLTLAVGASVVLSGCSANSGNDQFCGPLLADTATSATVFVVAVPGQANQAGIEERLALLETVEAPEELEDALDTWENYLEEVVDTIDADPGAAIAAYSEYPAVEAAGGALFSRYSKVCLG